MKLFKSALDCNRFSLLHVFMNVAIKETLVCDLRSVVPTKLSNNSSKSLLTNYNPFGNHLCFDVFKPRLQRLLL